MDALLDIRDIRFAYGRSFVLTGVDLGVERGKTLGLIGPNGGGKTTLLKLILGFLKPTAGSIRIDGLSPRDATARGDVVGYVPQKVSLNTTLPVDVRTLVRLGLAGKTGMLRPYAKDDLAFAESLLERVGLADLATTHIGQLSGGQLQRALVARALAPRPRLLLLDEPTLGIDLRWQQQFIELLQQMQREMNLAILFISHDLRAVTSVSHRIACLSTNLHFHDVPHKMPPELMYRMFRCDLSAMGLTTPCDDPRCSGDHQTPSIQAAASPLSTR